MYAACGRNDVGECDEVRRRKDGKGTVDGMVSVSGVRVCNRVGRSCIGYSLPRVVAFCVFMCM